MKFKLLVAAVSTAFAAFSQAGDHGHWSYEGHQGAPHWAELKEEFKTCGIGKSQAPIDIKTKAVKKANLKPIGFAYAAGAAEVVNNGHTIQINVPAGGSVSLDGVDYKLLQFHFHTPSEEKVDGKAYPLVAHFVHQNAEGKLAVVAVLFKEGKENAGLKAVFDNLPAKEGDVRALERSINPTDVLPVNATYYSFMGSLTTPPCSEDVRWQVMKTPVEVSKQQLAAFRKLFRMNARPVQPLNGRAVLSSS